MVFDDQKHADTLLEVECLVGNALMLCEGMAPANCQMGERQYIDAAAGAFGLMAYALNRVHDLMTEAESDFRLWYGPHYMQGSENEQNESPLTSSPSKVSM